MPSQFIRTNSKLMMFYTPIHRTEENRLLSCLNCFRNCHVLLMCLLSVTLHATRIFITSLITKNEKNINDDFGNQRRALTRNNHKSFIFMDEGTSFFGFLPISKICIMNARVNDLINKTSVSIFVRAYILKMWIFSQLHGLLPYNSKYVSKHNRNKPTKLSQTSTNNAIKYTFSFLSVPSVAIVFFSCLITTGLCNSPPRFMLDNANNGANIGGSGIVLRLKEGGSQAGQPTLGTKIYHLRGFDNDGDPLTFGVVSNPDGIIKVQNDPRGSNEANVVLARELDAEQKTQYEVVLSLTDGRLGSGNFITRSMLILVEDTNDNPPIFKPYPSTVSVKENSKPGTVVAILEATDADLGIFGQIKYSLASDEKDNDVFEIGSLQSVPNGAVVRLRKSLDYEIQSVYQLKVIAMDRGGFGGINGEGTNTAVAAVLVKVDDVEDRKPEFISVPSVTRVSEGVPKHTQVLQVSAVDGDRGVNNEISYSIVQGPSDIFGIDSKTGIIFTQNELDRESERSRESNGAFILGIRAREVGGRQLDQYIDTEVTIIIEDINDELPTFRSREYIGEINENAQKGTPVTFRISDNQYTEVFDHDRGTNGTFQLHVEGDQNIFEVFPHQIVNEASFTIRVKSSGDESARKLLDYEKNKVLRFNLVATEVVNPTRRNSVPVTVHLLDANDNGPIFQSPQYSVHVQENVKRGTVIANVQATDIDSGRYGTSGIRYTELRGQLAGSLTLDPLSGMITTGTDEEEGPETYFDRERINFHYLTVEARDDNGEGNRNSVELLIYVTDMNDNAPVFEANEYETYLPENSADFPGGFMVSAIDKDENGTQKAEVRYTIVGGNFASNFSIDKISGKIEPIGIIDFESVPDDTQNSLQFSPRALDVRANRKNRRMLDLVVRASDMGSPPLYNDVDVRIFVEDINDHGPRFEKDLYNVEIPENTKGGIPILKVKAVDNDGSSPNNEIFYRIHSGAVDKFVVDPINGQISVSPGANLDPDLIPRTSFGSQATNRKSYSYILEISAIDGGLGESQRLSLSIVNITILDVNNKPPYFDPTLFLGPFHVSENHPIGSEVTTVTAKDRDISSSLLYSIDTNESISRNEFGIETLLNVDNFFEIDEESGLISVVGNIDRESVEEFHLVVVVEDMNAEDRIEAKDAFIENAVIEGITRQMASTTITIIIDDVNDNSPKFREPFYASTVRENSDVGTMITTIVADDLDKNRTITYRMNQNSNDIEVMKALSIEQDTGKVFVADSIDFESMKWLNVSVLASDNGIPPRSSKVELYVQVLDENDNDPVFDFGNSDYGLQVEVQENTASGTVIANVKATDLDSGENGKITYFLDKRSASTGGGILSSDIIDRFKIHPDTGELTVEENLDREEQASYNLIVQAYDNYQYGFTTGKSRHTFAQLIVKVTDVNDQTPIFTSQLSNFKSSHEPRSDKPSNQGCSAVITEFHDAISDGAILTITAEDGDDPASPNGRLDFEIIDGNEAGLFRLDSKTSSFVEGTSSIELAGVSSSFSGGGIAKLYPKKRLKGYYGNYTITVKASDRGYPSNSATALYSICIQDFNDNAPVFLSPPSNFTLRVQENETIGAEVVRVHAIDTDIGSNGAVRYRIRKDPIGNYRTFKIDSVSGIITLAQSLDRERQKVYEIRVEAYDLGVPTPLMSDLDLTIYVRNINDHAPQFTTDIFVANFTENKAPGIERVIIINTIDRDDYDDYDVSPYDEERNKRDGNNNANNGVCYFIVGDGKGTNDHSNFVLHPTTHELIVSKELDREQKKEYELIVRATEECQSFLTEEANKDKSLDDEGVTFDPLDDSLLLVKVHVVDVDDNPPVFTNKIFTGGISTDVSYGSVFMQVHADDADVGNNALIKYGMYSDILSSDSSEGLENINNLPFLLDPENGEISLNFDPQKGMKGHFEFVITAEDKVGHIDAAKVQIYLLREDQRVRFVVRGQPKEIRSQIDEFRSRLSNITDSIVNVDAFLVHENDKTKTDVLLHFVDYRDNSVQEASDVLKIIDLHMEDLDPFFREFNVLHTEAAESGLNSFPAFLGASFNKTSGDSMVIILWLGGLCIFLFALLVLVLSLCLHQRSKYARKLRAATVGLQQSEESLYTRPRSSGLVPNTNKHAVEANPVWMTDSAYNNMTFQEENDGEETLDGNIIQKFERLEQEINNADRVQMDSLDANILNGSILENETKELSHGTNSSEDDHGFSSQYEHDNSHTNYISHMNKNMEHQDSPKRRIYEGSASESSGRGSGSSMNQFSNHAPKVLKSRAMFGSGSNNSGLGIGGSASTGDRIYARNLSIDSMFPPQMPPVESFPGMRSKGSANSSGASSKLGHHNMLPKKAKRGVTMYDNEGPKTEL